MFIYRDIAVITALVMIITLTAVYFGITTYMRMCDRNMETTNESHIAMRIADAIGKNGACQSASVEPIPFIYDELEGNAPTSYIITAKTIIRGRTKEYSCLVDGLDSFALGNGIDTIIGNIKKDIADDLIAC